MCERQPYFSCRIVPPGSVVRVGPDATSSSLSCSCCLNMEALFPDGPPCPPLPLSRCELHELLLALPRHLQYSPWHVCFDTHHDGFSLQNFYRTMTRVHECDENGIGLFVVTEGAPDSQDSSPIDASPDTPRGENTPAAEASVFGCFTPDVPCLEHSRHSFFGTPDTFVFTYADMTHRVTRYKCGEEQQKLGCVSLGDSRRLISRPSSPNETAYFHSLCRTATTPLPRILSTFPWVAEGANKEFVICANDFFGIGGGRDGAAIFVDENLLHGTSSVHCSTFDSPPLCGRAHATLRHSEFMILRMVWFSVRERKGCFTSMELPARELCDCGRLLEAGGAPRVTQSCHRAVAHTGRKSGGWHVCSDEQQQPHPAV